MWAWLSLQIHTYKQAYAHLFSFEVLCWLAVCVIGPCSHLKYEYCCCSGVQWGFIICFSAQHALYLPTFFIFLFFTDSDISVLNILINQTSAGVHMVYFSKSVPNEHQWYSENAHFGWFVSAAEPSRGERVPETSAPAGHCSCGSVSHAAHRWVMCKGWIK